MASNILKRPLARFFTTAFRHDGATYVKTTDDAPDWLRVAIRTAHGDTLPNDAIYEMCLDAATALDENGPVTDRDPHDDAHDFADSAVSCYHAARYRWLADSPGAADYCDEAQRQGLVSEASTMSDRIAAGWYLEGVEVYQTLAEAASEADPCEACNRTGELPEDRDGPADVPTECPTCEGTGEVPRHA